MKKLLLLITLLSPVLPCLSATPEKSKAEELYSAAWLNDAAKVKTLIEQEKIDPNAVDPMSGKTVLAGAASPLIPYLLAHGAHPSAHNQQQKLLTTLLLEAMEQCQTTHRYPSAEENCKNTKAALVALMKLLDCTEINKAHQDIEQSYSPYPEMVKEQTALTNIVTEIKEHSGCAQLERNKKDFFYTFKKWTGQYKGQRTK